jgi:transglutaminase-like putative cysteine protease
MTTGSFIDSDHPAIREKSRSLAGATPQETAVALYLAVRDGIRYDPYGDYLDPETFRASSVLEAGRGYCVGKASLFAALCRAAGIPARVGLADVRNHLATPRLLEAVGTDIFYYHGYAEVDLGGRRLKVSPTFNATLCEKLGVAPLPFDGETDALLQAHDASGRTFMAYLNDHGTFEDVPVEMIEAEMKRLYPQLCVPGGLRGSMENEAAQR